MKLSSLLVLIHFWININGESRPFKSDPRFDQFKKCLKNVPEWKIVGPEFNRSYYELFTPDVHKMYAKVYPIAIFTPQSTPDVQSAVKCGVKNEIKLVPISGGHSYAGLSIGTNDSILIDFRYMNRIHIDQRKKEVTAGAGTLLGYLYGTLWKNGHFGAPLGVCPTVALGGLVLGGGIGYFSPLYGLAIDNVLEMNMVDARGHEVHINETHNEDLWWALRGVGPGYIGLLTDVKLKLFKAADLKLTYVRVRFQNKSFSTVMENYLKWLDWVKRNDPSINTVIYIFNDNHKHIHGKEWGGIEVRILQTKDPRKKNTGNPAFKKEIFNIFKGSVDNVNETKTYIEFVNEVGEVDVMPPAPETYEAEDRIETFSKLTRDMTIPHYYKVKSFYVKKRYNAENLLEAEKVLLEMPNNACMLEVNTEQGAISKFHANESSYVHRNALFNLRVSFDSKDVDEVAPSKEWMKKMLNALKFLDSGETYQNYPDRDLDDYLKRYYGDNLDRLLEIKKKWDPRGYFRSDMSLPIK